MRFDPAADPWGAAMLAAAVLWLLALLAMVAALLAKTSRRTGGYLMLVSLLVFLGAAVGGTWDRIRQADALVGVAPQGVPVDSGAAAGESGGSGDGGAGEPGTAAGDRGGSTGGEATGAAIAATGDATLGDASTGDATGAAPGTSDATLGDAAGGSTGDATLGDAAGGSTGDATTGDAAAGSTGDTDPSAGEEPSEDTGEPAEPEPAVAVTVPGDLVVPEDLPKVSPLPDEPRAREEAIQAILDDAARAAGGGERCGNLERVATAWARLQTIPVTRKAKKITSNLERCRRRLLYSISRKRLAEMVDARDAWYAKMPTKIRKQHGLIVQSALSGGSHERLRIGNRELDAKRADAIMEAGLRDDLVRLQFAHVVLTNGKKSKIYELPVTPENDLGLPWLRAVGLGDPLALSE
jgi:hypothetical protein